MYVYMYPFICTSTYLCAHMFVHINNTQLLLLPQHIKNQQAVPINENLLECMGRCSILAVRLYNLARHVGSQNAVWLKEVIEIKKERPFFEDIIGIRK